MKLLQRTLATYIDLPGGERGVRDLLDDIGIEVKRINPSEQGNVITVELLANRGDHACYTGVATEISGRTGDVVSTPDFAKLEVGTSPWPLELQSDLCLLYTATLLERSGEFGPLPDELLASIEATGVHSVGPEVDATNLSNLEFGQPTHAFDADTIKGAVCIRAAVAGETCLPLFSESRAGVPEGALVIADDEKILAVAGVIGCEESKTTASTKRLLLESATFDPVAVRKTARAMGINTDSSSRFERGADPSLPLVGAGRVTLLLEQFSGWKRVGTTGVVGAWTDPERVIALDIPAAANFIVHPLTAEEAKLRLERYGFTVSSPYPTWKEEGWATPPALEDRSRESLRSIVLVRVPAGRLWDVEHTADLYEELAKSIGYNNTPNTLPPVDMGKLPSDSELAKAKAEQVLVGAGFYEVFTDGFYSRAAREALGFHEEHPLWNHVETQNALDRGYSLLKNNCLAQAMEGLATNIRVRNERVRMFEWTRTFHPDASASNGVCSEHKVLWALASEPGRKDDWTDKRSSLTWILVGIVEELAAELNLPLTVGPADSGDPLFSALHPGRQASIRLHGERVGILGEVHPAVVANHKLKRTRPVYIELDGDVLRQGPRPDYSEPPQHHPSVRNLAFSMPTGVRARDIAEHMATAGPAWLSNVSIVDQFAHEEDGVALRSVTYALTYANDASELSADEINAASEYLIKVIHEVFGQQGVKLR